MKAEVQNSQYHINLGISWVAAQHEVFQQTFYYNCFCTLVFKDNDHVLLTSQKIMKDEYHFIALLPFGKRMIAPFVFVH